MAWTTNPYCTLADVKTAMDVQSTTDDAWLQTLIGEAQEEIDRYIGYPFQTDGTVASPATRFYDGNGNPQLWIDDCLSFASVKETNYNVIQGDQGVFTIGNPVVMDITADCLLYPYNSQPGFLLKRISDLPFDLGRKNIQVQGVFGQPSVPSPITRATKLLVIHYYKRRDATYGAQTATKQFGPRQYAPIDLPCEVTDILDRYRERLFLNRV